MAFPLRGAASALAFVLVGGIAGGLLCGGAAGAAGTAPAPIPQPAAAKGQVTSLPIPRFVSMRADTANARRGPSLDQRVDWEFVQRGMPLEVTAEYGQWRRVRDADGMGGWVHHTLLSGVRTALIRGDAAVPLRAGPTEGAAVHAMAEPGVIGRLEECHGAWCELSTGGVDGWLPRAVLWGVGPDEEIE